MPNDAEHDLPVTDELITLTERARARAEEDPFGNPVLAVALAITRLMDEGELPQSRIAALIRHLRDEAFNDRAMRIAAYVGGTDPVHALAEFDSIATRAVRPDPDDSPVPLKVFREAVEKTRFGVVFTAHPHLRAARAGVCGACRSGQRTAAR